MEEDSDVELVEPSAGGDSSRVKFQRVTWQHKLLPYHEELQKEADFYFSNVKSGLAYSILMRDARPGLIFWVHELDRFIQLYSYRFSKIDHINMVKLLYNALTMKGLDFRVVKVISNVLHNLLVRKSLLSREDLQLDWRPLYELYVEVCYKNLEEDGLLLLPDDMKKSLNQVILEVNHFFKDEATQEILDEVRPYFCPWDDSFIRGISVMAVFIPTAYAKEEHGLFGAHLWLDEIFYWMKNPATFDKIREKIFYILARLAKDCPGYCDFTPHFDHLFSIAISALKLEVGIDRIVASTASTHMMGSLTQIFAYCFGFGENKIQDHIRQLFLTLESYFHPSNTGAHTTTLLNFLLKFCSSFLYRVGRERYHSHRYRQQIPLDARLDDHKIDLFVKSILPCLEYAAFSKTKAELVPSIIRLLAFLSPGLIIPFVLDLVYPALQTVTEPHRLTQSLQILACICVPLVRDDPTKSEGERRPVKSVDDMEAHLRSYRRHAISILNNVLPALDVNDIAKSTLGFQIIAILLLLIPVVDCSQASLVCSGLSEEEQDLCSATATLDGFIGSLLDKIFSLIELFGNGANERHFLTKPGVKNTEELVIERGVLTVFRALVKGTNSGFYQYIANRFFNFAAQFICNSKPALDMVTKMASIIINNDPLNQFSRFFNLCVRKFEHHDHENSEDEEEVDHSLIWYLNFASEVIRGVSDGKVLVENQQIVIAFIDKIMRFKSTQIFKLAATLLQNTLYCLCSVYPHPKIHRDLYDQPFEKFLPIREWARTIEKEKWSLDWHIPSDAEVDFAVSLVEQFVNQPIENLLQNASKLSDKELLKTLTVARFALEGCCNLCPFFDGPFISLIPMATPNCGLDVISVPNCVKRIKWSDGRNYRVVLYQKIKILAQNVLKERENDTKSLIELLHIVKVLLHNRGIDQASFALHSSNFQLTKRILSDPLRGYKEAIEPVMEGTITIMHMKRMQHRPLVGITETHLDAFKLLFQFATSMYSVVRMEAQKMLDSSFVWWSFSYRTIIDDVHKILLNPDEHSYEELKGAIYILVNGKETSILVRQCWDTISKIWPSLSLVAPPEGKPTIVALLDLARDLIINNFSSFQIYFTFANSLSQLAKQLLLDYDGNVHKDTMKISDELIAESVSRERELNSANIQRYEKLALDLNHIAVSKELHWRHIDFAQALLSLLLRKDAELPEPVVLTFFDLVVSDSIKARKMAIAFCGAWLKIHRQKAIKAPHPLSIEENTGPGAHWPIKFGFRKDNSVLLYDEDKRPTTQEGWDSARFFHKPHWGFYTWPKKFLSYAPPAEQNWANRNIDQLNELEKKIISLLKADDYLQKLANLYSLEEKKGSEEFDATNFMFFYRLFRAFNDILFTEYCEVLQPLLRDTMESRQRLATEMVAGLICGSKLWTYEKHQKMVQWLTPSLTLTLLEITQECENNWGTCLATIFGVCEPNQLGWVIELLFQLIEKPTDVHFHVKARLYLLHCALNQAEWRIPAQWRKLTDHCLQLVAYPFQNVRLRVGSCLATAAFYDLKDMFIDEKVAGKYNLVRVEEIVDSINSQLVPLWEMVLNGNIRHIDSAASLGELEASTDEFKNEKLVLMSLNNLLQSLKAQFGLYIESAAIKMIPLFTHFSNETVDEELKVGCVTLLVHTIGLSQIFDSDIEFLFQTCLKIQQNGIWWKAKISLLRFLQIFAFTNLFALQKNSSGINNLRELVLSLLVDPRFEVRVASAETLSGLVRASIIAVDATLLDQAKQMITSADAVRRHSGILALSAVVRAFPYSVPSFLPDVLMQICRHASDPQPIYGTVKLALNDFKRTHQDEWHEHKLEFTEDQLQILTNLIISPNYYV